MHSFTDYMKTRIVEIINDSTDEDFIRYIYTTINEFQIINTRENQETLLEITGTC
jgi:hypothetical protein